MTGPRSLRGRLTLVFTAVAAAVVLAIAAGMAVLIEHAVWAPLDAALEEEAETLVSIGKLGGSGNLDRSVAHVGAEPDLGGGKFIRVVAGDGRLLAGFGEEPAVVAALPAPAGRTAHATVGKGRRGAYRVVWHTVPDGTRYEIGVRVGGQLHTLRRAYRWVVYSALALIATLAALAWTITTRATAELDRLGAELETLEAGSLDRRLAARRTTEVDRLATVLNRLLTRLEAAMEHLRRFTADAAHELRTPIAALRAHLEVALGRPRSTEAYRDGLLDALEQTERLGRLAEDLLTLSAVEAGVARPGEREETVRLDELAREVAEFLEPVAQEQGRRFGWRAEGALAVRGAPDLLKRLVLNLVDNAFRHTPPSAAVELAIGTDDGEARIEVRDEGAGILEADVPHVFERFRRGRGATRGTGLGLALCREIVVRHGGRIVLHSVPGTGTTVTVTLPLAAPGALP
jgi:signal transduction histidine kinase